MAPTPRRLARFEDVAHKRTSYVTLLLDNVHDPHNVSAVLRTADAAGLTTIHAHSRNAPLKVSPKVARGATRWVNLRQYASVETAIATLREQGYALGVGMPDPNDTDIATSDVKRPTAIDKWIPTRPTAFVLGNEHDGVSEALINAADIHFTIPQRGFVESLNISVAAAIVMMTARRILEAHQPDGWLLSEEDASALQAKWTDAERARKRS